MYLDEYQKKTINQFNGLFKRGTTDEVPEDHASDLLNVKFNKKQQFTQREGTAKSFTLTGLTSPGIVRFFLATFATGSALICCTLAGNIVDVATNTIIVSIAGMIDFAAVNIFDKCFILPILSAFDATIGLYVWDGVNTPRNAAGYPPISTTMSAAAGSSGNVPPGVHQFAVSYITDTGYTTPPGPVPTLLGAFTPVTITTPGGTTVVLSNIPTGSSEVVGRQIFATQAGLDVFYYLQTINDNTTTSITVDFFDTDLAVSADSLFDLVPLIPSAATVFGGASLYKYNNRLIVIGNNRDTVMVSNLGDAESFDDVVGMIILPSEFDGNYVRAACSLFGNLYFTKSVGIFSTIDNGEDPNTWNNGIPTQIDGGVGCYQSSIGTLSISQPSLSTNSIILMANREGLFMFNGNIIRPQLSWKIQDVWDTITHAYEGSISIAVDTFKDIIYVLLPTGGSTTPNTLLVGDYSAGLDPKNIRWSIYTFPFVPISLGMLNFDDGTSFDYFLRLTDDTGVMYRLDPSETDDFGTAIDAYYQFAPFMFAEGAVNIFRFIRFRATGSGSLVITLTDEDGQNAITPPSLTLASTPSLDIGEQINFTNEKMLMKVEITGDNKSFLISRADVFGKPMWGNRPNG